MLQYLYAQVAQLSGCSLPYKSDSLKVDNLSNFKLFNYEKIKIHGDPDCGYSQAV